MKDQTHSIQFFSKAFQNPGGQAFLKSVGYLAVAYLLWRAVAEFYLDAPVTGLLIGKFSSGWAATFVGWVFFCLLLLAIATMWLVAPQRLSRARNWFLSRRERLGALRWVITALFVLLPAVFFLFLKWGGYFETPALRTVVLAASGGSAALFISRSREKLAEGLELGFGILLAATIFYTAKQLVWVNNLPFALGWSEGNRLYDYSFIFGGGRYLYSDEAAPLRKDIGRQLLWGLPFLIPNTPIWFHRAWNFFLATAPSLSLGYFLSRWGNLAGLKRWVYILWVFLFLAQGPIYTPLVISALAIILFVRPGKWLVASSAGFLAGYYASLSRFTWLPAAPVWAGFVLLDEFQLPRLEFPRGKKGDQVLAFLRSLSPVIFISGISLVGGLLASPRFLRPKELSTSVAFAQPLLWYRLFPNVTYPEGILLALLLACGPLAALLVWLAASKRWRLNWVQAAAYTAGSLVFLGAGLVASVKIGGGNNLHNLDMFFISLAILSGMALRARNQTSIAEVPGLWRALLALILVIPAWSAYRTGSSLSLPPADRVGKALTVIQNRVSEASQQGEILFMDQRQLLTFGYIQGIPLVTDYEKKFVMDQAMAADQDYFEQFYQDLANQRFALIVSDPLFTRIKESTYAFSEENNAWVQWVAQPLLCYYAPVRKIPENVLDDFDIQMLAPRINPQGCP
jgi:hypothetical protein